ncbi:MAG: HlyC/CorC family transporter, partial [Chloroflexi bacterium]|nr:HlyC/CorC family transporter [Chloroflexota bacterium]
VDQANEQLGLSLPEGNYETVAGFVLNLMGHIPAEGEQIKYENLLMAMTKMEGTKIGKILITKGK